MLASHLPHGRDRARSGAALRDARPSCRPGASDPGPAGSDAAPERPSRRARLRRLLPRRRADPGREPPAGRPRRDRARRLRRLAAGREPPRRGVALGLARLWADGRVRGLDGDQPRVVRRARRHLDRVQSRDGLRGDARARAVPGVVASARGGAPGRRLAGDRRRGGAVGAGREGGAVDQRGAHRPQSHGGLLEVAGPARLLERACARAGHGGADRAAGRGAAHAGLALAVGRPGGALSVRRRHRPDLFAGRRRGVRDRDRGGDRARARAPIAWC